MAARMTDASDMFSAAAEAIPVSTGFTWTAAGAWASFAALLGLLGVVVRQYVPLRKTNLDADQKLREDLLQRVEKLEAQLERQQVRHSAERALDRHRLNNVTQCFDALLLLIETAPEKAAEAVVKIKEMRKAQLIAEAEEKAIIRAADIAAIDKEPSQEA